MEMVTISGPSQETKKEKKKKEGQQIKPERVAGHSLTFKPPFLEISKIDVQNP